LSGSRSLAEAEIASRESLKDRVFPFEGDLSVEALDKACVATAGEYAAQFLNAQAAVEFCIPALGHVEAGGEFPALPAGNPRNNISDHFENFLPSKLIAKGIHYRRQKTSFDLTPLQNSGLI
jgi:hypothetical protein